MKKWWYICRSNHHRQGWRTSREALQRQEREWRPKTKEGVSKRGGGDHSKLSSENVQTGGVGGSRSCPYWKSAPEVWTAGRTAELQLIVGHPPKDRFWTFGKIKVTFSWEKNIWWMILLAIVWLCNCLLTFSFKKCWEGGLRLGAFTLSKVIVSLTKIQCIVHISWYKLKSIQWCV